MYPGFHAWWKHARGHGHGHGHHAACGQVSAFDHGGFGPRGFEGGPGGYAMQGFDPTDVSSAFGVRRPLRFLAHKLELSESQVASFAAILDELKTERAQAAVDQRRRTSALAEALEASELDESKVREAGAVQLQSAERLRAAVEAALKKMHAALDPEQRKQLAYMLRTGALSI